jgi:multicomponent K+:H+ antiporter subunit F
MAFAVARLIIGPAAPDRVLALDTLYVDAMLLILVLGMREASLFYFEVALVIAMLGFVSTAALAKFLLRGEVIE